MSRWGRLACHNPRKSDVRVYENRVFVIKIGRGKRWRAWGQQGGWIPRHLERVESRQVRIDAWGLECRIGGRPMRRRNQRCRRRRGSRIWESRTLFWDLKRRRTKKFIKKIFTIEDCSYPMEDCSPEINPSNKLQVIWWVGLCIENVEYGFVKHSDGS